MIWETPKGEYELKVGPNVTSSGSAGFYNEPHGRRSGSPFARMGLNYEVRAVRIGTDAKGLHGSNT